MVEPAGMQQGHQPVVLEDVAEPEATVLAHQGIAAGADHHPAHLRGQAEEVARLHQAQLDQRICAGHGGKPGDLGARVVAPPFEADLDRVVGGAGRAGARFW